MGCFFSTTLLCSIYWMIDIIVNQRNKEPLLDAYALAVVASEFSFRAGRQLDWIYLLISFGFKYLSMIWCKGVKLNWITWYCPHDKISPLTDPPQCGTCRLSPQKSQHCEHLHKKWKMLKVLCKPRRRDASGEMLTATLSGSFLSYHTQEGMLVL